MFDLSLIGIEWGSALMLVMLLGLLLTGKPLAFVTLLVAMFFTFFWIGPKALPLITSRIYGFTTSYVFVAVPMFVLMASILDRSGIAKDLFNAMNLIGGRLRGGVAVQTIVVAVFLAAMSGIIGGETVLLGLLALPQMLRLGYNRNLAIGTVCAGGALGTMMPPSIVLIIYGLIANVSIGDLFTASFVPALMLGGFYVAYVLIRAHLKGQSTEGNHPARACGDLSAR
jgi:tripartite ATP-independent transporter DctM subunit